MQKPYIIFRLKRSIKAIKSFLTMDEDLLILWSKPDEPVFRKPTTKLHTIFSESDPLIDTT
ncbi:MAG: hypothetical protein ACJAVV_002126 [Alphaproteobacteria bacterium]|jgi:hypothetical protein